MDTLLPTALGAALPLEWVNLRRGGLAAFDALENLVCLIQPRSAS
jgi:hypothetical protein